MLRFIPSGGASVQSRHHPEHRESRGNRPGRPRAVLRPREDEPPQRALSRSKQEHGAEGLPWHVRGHLRLSIGPGVAGQAVGGDERL